MKKAAYSLIILLGIAGCSTIPRTQGYGTKKPKRIILLIGDGMGLTQISSLYVESDNTTNFNRFTHVGLMNPKSASHKITDSAAGATAFACGKKTYNGAIGMGPDTTSIPNLVEILSARKYETGVVATSAITHATPASFYSHTIHRKLEYDIAGQLLKSDIDFFAGGGSKFFAHRESDMKLYNWTIDSSKSVQPIPVKSRQGEERLGYLLGENGLPTAQTDRGYFLHNASEAAITFLDKSKYFLMIEGSQIDWGGHANDYSYVNSEMKDFDKVLGYVLDYAEKDGETLVIVTADHETGGLALNPKAETDLQGKTHRNYDAIEPSFTTGGHTAALIPVFAYGPGAAHFTGMYENTDIFMKILELAR